jgi:4a-hydroxytetrahydrobiopterin dehydratase
MSMLSQVACTAIRPGEPVLSDEEMAELHPMVPAWKVKRGTMGRKLLNTFTFDDVATRDDFLVRLAELAGREGRELDTSVMDQSVEVGWSTPELHDLHPNDFILAAKTEGAFRLATVGREGDMAAEEELPTLAEVPRFRATFTRLRGQPGPQRVASD